jgi:hypothetical protein
MKNINAQIAVTVALFLLVSPCWGQNVTQTFDDCASIQTVLLVSGDTFLVKCDSVYLLNKLTFRQYDGAYRDIRKRGSSVSNLMNAYDEIIGLQQNRLEEQAKSYNELRSNFSSLAGDTQTKIAESSTRLNSAVASLENLNNDLVETKRLLGEAKEIINTEKSWLNLEKLMWGTGGLVVGVVLGAVLTK